MLCEGWQPKTTSAVDSGTKQKTEDFEVRKNCKMIEVKQGPYSKSEDKFKF